jgi:hypothetical protein
LLGTLFEAGGGTEPGELVAPEELREVTLLCELRTKRIRTPLDDPGLQRILDGPRKGPSSLFGAWLSEWALAAVLKSPLVLPIH